MLITSCDVATSIVRPTREGLLRDDAEQASVAGTNGDDFTIGIWGDVRLFMPGQGTGCVACVGGLANQSDTLYEIAAPSDTRLRGTKRPWYRQRPGGSLIMIGGICASVLTQAWVDSLSGVTRNSQWHRLECVPGAGILADSRNVGSAEDCPFCSIDRNTNRHDVLPT